MEPDNDMELLWQQIVRTFAAGGSVVVLVGGVSLFLM
jgi:hypothetical protein